VRDEKRIFPRGERKEEAGGRGTGQNDDYVVQIGKGIDRKRK